MLVGQDADILWFRDPFPNFAADSDFQIACDKYMGGPFDVSNNAPNGGFLYVRSNHRTMALYRYTHTKTQTSRLHHRSITEPQDSYAISSSIITASYAYLELWEASKVSHHEQTRNICKKESLMLYVLRVYTRCFFIDGRNCLDSYHIAQK